MRRPTIYFVVRLFMVLAMLSIFGCASTIRSSETGIPYYLPKPCLLITKNIGLVQAKTVTETTKEDKKEIVRTTAEPIMQAFINHTHFQPAINSNVDRKCLQYIGTFKTM